FFLAKQRERDGLQTSLRVSEHFGGEAAHRNPVGERRMIPDATAAERRQKQRRRQESASYRGAHFDIGSGWFTGRGVSGGSVRFGGKGSNSSRFGGRTGSSALAGLTSAESAAFELPFGIAGSSGSVGILGTVGTEGIAGAPSGPSTSAGRDESPTARGIGNGSAGAFVSGVASGAASTSVDSGASGIN